MKKATLLLCLLMAHVWTFGQKLPDNTQVKWGKERKFDKKMTLTEIAASDETGFYILKRKVLQEIRGFATLPFLEKYDQNLNFVKSVDLSRSGLPGSPVFEQLLIWDDQLWLFYMTDPGNGAKNGLYRIALDSKTLKPKGKGEFVLAAGKKNAKPLLGSMGMGLKRNRSQYHISTYDEHGKLLIVHEHAEISKNQKLIDLVVFDSQFNLIWEKEEKIVAKSDRLDIVNTLMDENGNVHLLSEDKLSKGISVMKTEESLFTLTSILESGEKTLHKKLDSDHFRIQEAKINADTEGNVYVGGIYTETRGNRRSGGTYLLKLNGSNQEKVFQRADPIDEAFLTSGSSKTKAKKTSRKLRKGRNTEDAYFHLDEIMIKDNGAIVFVGEDRLETTSIKNRDFNNPGVGSSTSTSHRYGNIVVAEFEPNGERKWIQKVLKDQRSRDDGGFFFSYSVSMINDNLYFIFNDNIKNLAYKGHGKVVPFNPKKPKQQIMAFVKVDGEGKMERSFLSMYRERSLMTIIPMNTKVGYHEMVVYGLNKKKYRLAKLAFDPNLVAEQ